MYEEFIEEFAGRSKVLADLTKKKRIFKWTEEVKKSFEDLKTCLITAPLSRCPDFQFAV